MAAVESFDLGDLEAIPKINSSRFPTYSKKRQNHNLCRISDRYEVQRGPGTEARCSRRLHGCGHPCQVLWTHICRVSVWSLLVGHTYAECRSGQVQQAHRDLGIASLVFCGSSCLCSQCPQSEDIEGTSDAGSKQSVDGEAEMTDEARKRST